jgi:cytochrome c oxidase subunit II
LLRIFSLYMTGLIQLGLGGIAQAATWIPLHPPTASSIAQDVDLLYYFLTVLTLFFTALIFGIIFFFMVKFRRRSPDEVPADTKTHLSLELTWTIIPTLITFVIFVWASVLYVRNSRPPAAAAEMFVVGKQWMWHIQHPEGVREINEMHVPVGVPVKLTMTSEDVIHDFYIPAFRVKKDVMPGRYSSIWFQPTETGTYHLFCAQYCGTDHSEMIGWVYVMSPTDYAAWLAGGTKNESMAQTGGRLFMQLGCVACHSSDNSGRGPSLAGIYGTTQKMRDGNSKTVDEVLIRQAIVNPNSILLPNYPPIMPTFQGQVNEEQVLQLIAYVKSLEPEERTTSSK